MPGGFRFELVLTMLSSFGQEWRHFFGQSAQARYRGWRVLASFKTTEEVRAFLAERPDDEVEIVTG